MDNRINNHIVIEGTMGTAFRKSHSVIGETFYSVPVQMQRTSGTVDKVQVMVSERLFDVKTDRTGEAVRVEGQFRSYNKQEGTHRRLQLFVFANSFEIIEEARKINDVEIKGHICKPPVYRKTPLGREIADLLVAVNRAYGKSDYIPCIAWGRNACFAQLLNVGDCLKLAGRIQSREYNKVTEEGSEKRIAYELSVNRMEVLAEEEEGKKEYLELLRELGCPEGMDTVVLVEMERYGIVAMRGWNGDVWTNCYMSNETGYPVEVEPGILRFRPVCKISENGCSEVVGFKELTYDE